MEDSLKKSQISIKWKTFCIFLIFAIVLLGVLWFFQIVYLNDFYKMIKQKETENVLDRVEALLHESDDPASEIDQLAASYNLGVFITDSDGNSLYNAEYISNSQMSSLPHFMFSLFYDEAVANGGEAVIEFKGSEMQRSIRENLNQGTGIELPEGVDGESEATPESEFEQPENILENAPDSAKDTSKESSGQGEGKIEYTIPQDNEMLHEQFRQNIGNEMAESVIYVRIIEVDGQEEVVMINSVVPTNLVPFTVTAPALSVFTSASKSVVKFIPASILTMKTTSLAPSP